MKTQDTFTAGDTVAHVYERGADAQTAAARLRGAGFSDVRLSEYAGRTREAHVGAESGQTETDFSALLERAGFAADRAREVTRAVAAGAVLLTVAAGARAADAAAVLRGERVSAAPLTPAAVAMTPEVTSQATDLRPGDRVIPLRAEQLEVRTERASREARVRKETVTEERTITVPVQHEELVVERDGARDVRIPLRDDDR